MCFRPAEAGGIEHRCPECGTNNLPEATMCANCFAPMEPLDMAALMREAAAAGTIAPEAAPGGAPAPGAPKAPAAPKAPGAPAPARPQPAPAETGQGVSFGDSTSKADEPGVGEVFSF